MAWIFKILDMFSPWGYIALVAIALLAYDKWIDDPAIARAARAGYVTEATHAALEAERQELLRQWAAAESTAAKWHAALVETEKAQEVEDAQGDLAIAQYQAEISVLARECRKLDKRDLDFLQRNRAQRSRR